MKTPRWFSRNRLLSYLRIATAGTLISAEAAMAFVSTAPPSLKVAGKSPVDEDTFSKLSKFRRDRDQLRGLPGVERDGGPLLAAEEDYANRAYPATDIPFSATVNARAAFKKVQARSNSSGNTDTWNLIGPSTANIPDVLTFSGAATTYSGRITALAIDTSCTVSNCRVWVAAAGGGIWRTNNALAGTPSWTFVSGSFATNAIGTLTYAGGVLYAGTGEPNASGDSEAGLGIYKSIDGGTSWTHLAANTSVAAMATSCGTAPAYSGPAFNGRAISSIVVNGSTIYVGSTRAVRGVSSVTGGGVTLAPALPPVGLWKRTDGGANFTLLNAQGICLNPALAGDAGKIQSSFGSLRGVNHVELDPSASSTLYAAAFQHGVWRSANGGSSWTQIFAPTSPSENTERAEFAVTLKSGHTRMYVGDGS